MAENLTKFILEIAQNPQLVSNFQKDPDSVVQRAGLSPAEAVTLQSGDARIIREAIAADLGSRGGAAAEGITVVVLTYTRMPSSIRIKVPEIQTDFQSRIQQLMGK